LYSLEVFPDVGHRHARNQEEIARFRLGETAREERKETDFVVNII